MKRCLWLVFKVPIKRISLHTSSNLQRLHRLKAVFLSLLTIFLIFSPFCSSAHAQIVQPTIQKYELPSGQTLYIEENHDQPIVTIDTWVTTGSVNETPQFNGVSHFLEHLLFKGTEKHKAGEIDRLLESTGAHFNAATSDDFTHFYITTASRFFKQALELHADMMLHAQIPPDELQMERKVVQEEINRATDNPNQKIYKAVAKLLYRNHPYAMETLGPKENIATIPRQNILDYYHYWYQPKHLNTIIVGDVDPKLTLQWVKSFFPANGFHYGQAGGKSSYTPPKIGSITPLSEPQVKIIEDPNISEAYYALAFLGPGIENREKTYAMDVAMMILGEGRSSRLYQVLKEEKSLVTDVSAENFTQKYSGLLYIGAEMKPENLMPAHLDILNILQRVKKEGITAQELEKAKTETIKDFIFHNESVEGVANSIGYNVTIGTLKDYTDYVANIQKVTLKDVQTAMNEYLKPESAVLVVLAPKGSPEAQNFAKEALPTLQTTGSKTGQPSQNASKNPESAPIFQTHLDNGMTLVMKPRKDSNTVAINIFIKGGQLVEPIPGLASMTANLLLKGTQGRSAQQLDQEIESKGLNLSVSAGDDYLQVTGTSVKEDLGELFLLIEDILTAPAFAPSEIMKAKQDIRESLMAKRDNPSEVALENLYLNLYPNHPYGDVGKRVINHLDAIQRPDIEQFFDTYVVPKNMVVSIVGAFDPNTIMHYFKAGFPKSLNDHSFLTSDLYQQSKVVPALKKDDVIEENKATQAATWIAKGWLAPEIVDEQDHVPLKVVNALLGDGLSSRLFVDLREKQGLAYVISSFYPSTREQSQFVLYIGTDPKNRQAVLEGFDQEIDRLKTTLVGDKELRAAKDKLTGEFALAHETNANQAFYLGLYETLGAGYGYDVLYPKLIQATTAEDIRRVARKYFSQPSITSIVAPVIHQNAKPAAKPVEKGGSHAIRHEG